MSAPELPVGMGGRGQFLRNFLVGNFYFRADGDGAVEFSLLERFHGRQRARGNGNTVYLLGG
jgi:hypothetical protein